MPASKVTEETKKSDAKSKLGVSSKSLKRPSKESEKEAYKAKQRRKEREKERERAAAKKAAAGSSRHPLLPTPPVKPDVIPKEGEEVKPSTPFLTSDSFMQPIFQPGETTDCPAAPPNSPFSKAIKTLTSLMPAATPTSSETSLVAPGKSQATPVPVKPPTNIPLDMNSPYAPYSPQNDPPVPDAGKLLVYMDI